MSIYKKEEAELDASAESRFESGTAVGDLAMSFLGPYVDVTKYKDEGEKKLDYDAMILKTEELLRKGTENICEASFLYDGNYCAVDILHKCEGGYEIYEVKSSTDSDPSKFKKYAPDIAYQKWVLEKCGVKVVGTYLVCINHSYRLHSEIGVKELFVKVEASGIIAGEYEGISGRIDDAKGIVMLGKGKEPDMMLNPGCKNPYKCQFLKYCRKFNNIPEDSVFDLYNVSWGKAVKLSEGGTLGMDRCLVLTSFKMNPIQKIQVDCTVNGKVHVNKEGIWDFVKQIEYPLYFLDFETMQPALPEYEGTGPYQQIPFQYSLHILKSKDGPLLHKEFLAESGPDPRRPLAEQLCKDIPVNVCVLAYNDSFEKNRIEELANTFEDLSGHLRKIKNNIRDLLDVFKGGNYYVPAMKGSFSIKSVLPALFPNDPELDYHKLDEWVQNGGDAMNIFPRIKDMNPEDRDKARKALLEYCKLDTYAMVKVWENLNAVIEE